MGVKLQKTAPVRRLPLMANFEEAIAVYQQEKDPFYLAAFMSPKATMPGS
jgi:hypothetical protein